MSTTAQVPQVSAFEKASEAERTFNQLDLDLIELRVNLRELERQGLIVGEWKDDEYRFKPTDKPLPEVLP